MKVSIVGVAGGSCSGKTTFVKRASQLIGQQNCALVLQDHYYVDQSQRFDKDGGAVNFDHPSAIEFSLLRDHLEILSRGESVLLPEYDFATHQRRESQTLLEARRIILVDGTMILSQPEILTLLDCSFFICCERELRYARRLERDVLERGRQPEGVFDQFENQVEPMHQMFVEPSKVNARYIILQDEYLTLCDSIIRDKLIEPLLS